MIPYYHLMNMRTPFDGISQDMLVAFGDYRISLPIEAEPAPGITPIPQAQMIQNGIVGLYVPANATEIPNIAMHWPIGAGADITARPSIVSHST